MVRREIVHCLKNGGIGVMPTDTLYGLVGSALRSATVARIYRVRHREPGKPFIVLIASPVDVKKFGVRLPPRTVAVLEKLWPGPVSVILPCPGAKFRYLHRGTRSLAFRVPKPPALRALLRKTGPLVAPSANPAGRPPAATPRAAWNYFGANVDFYVGGGRLSGAPSALIEVKR
ncbi:MAG: L-threonylcarbamoyladenylate synthase [Patescibacteria group bacterium]